jgi:YVTN family beta-propeller protein
MGLGAGLSACGLNQEGVPPPRDRIVYPASARLDAHGQWLYVANSNSDLRYNNGTLVAVDVELAATDYGRKRDTWKVCPRAAYVRSYAVGLADGDVDKDGIGRCCWDYFDHTVLDCDERKYVNAASTIEIGSFAAGMEFQRRETSTFAPPATTRHQCAHPGSAPQGDGGADASPDAGTGSSGDGGGDVEPTVTEGRLFIGVRGNSSITYIDTKADSTNGAPTLSCGSSTKDSKDCSIAHSLVGMNETPLTVPDEPYALYLDETADLLYVGHLRGDTAHPDTGGVSLFDVARRTPDAAPTFLHASRGFFPADGNGFFGVTSLTPGPGNQLYATSRYLPVAIGLNAAPDPNLPLCDPKATNIFVSASSLPFTSPLAGVELRGLQFVSPKRAFALQRVPPALVGFDVTGGILGNVATDIVETCAAPTFLQAFGDGADRRLFVTCFEAGQVYVVDPSTPSVVAVIEAGRGPAGLVFSAETTTPARAYIVGFGHNNVSVVDLETGSPTQYHVIQRLGFPSVLPR